MTRTKNDNNPFSEDRVSSLGMHRYAEDFFQAYTLLSDKKNNAIQVRYYLICHSLELSMKAVLREAGYSVGQLLKLGHDIEKISNELEQNKGINAKWDEQQKAIIHIANIHYKSKEMEYFAQGTKSLVDFSIFSNFLAIWLRISHNTIMELKKAKKLS